MTVPVFPVPLIRSLSRRLAVAAAVVTSPFTGTEQVQDWGGAWWEYDLQMAILHGAQARALSAFLAGMRGPVGTFLLADPSIYNPTGVGVPLVNGAGQTGSSLVTDGWTAPGMKAGDFFQLGSDTQTRLYQLTADVVPAAGAATVQFVPALRTSPADNQALVIAAPQVRLRLTSAVPATVTRFDRYEFTMTAREAL